MRPRCFLELPAGLAAVSLRLHGGKHCRPPISRMGNKAGYAEVILAAMGLRSGEGAGSYVWAEADPDVRALLRAYPDAAMLRRIADIIRGWADEEPRALWERLRAERKARTPNGTSHVPGPLSPSNADDAASVAAFAQIVSGNRLVNMGGPDLMNTGNGGTRFGGADFATPAADVAEAFERVAGWVTLGQLAFRQAEPESGFNPGMDRDSASPCWRPSVGDVGESCGALSHGAAWPPVAVLPAIPRAADVAAWLGTPGDLEGCVVYMDGPYEGTTGYLHELPRVEQVRIALDYHALGAVVCVSEAVPVNELTALGWRATDITGGRKGQRRTFARVATEALTMDREPQATVAVQVGMFA